MGGRTMAVARVGTLTVAAGGTPTMRGRDAHHGSRREIAAGGGEKAAEEERN